MGSYLKVGNILHLREAADYKESGRGIQLSSRYFIDHKGIKRFPRSDWVDPEFLDDNMKDVVI